MSDRIKDAFDKIHAKDELKNHTKEFLLKKTASYKKSFFLLYQWRLAVVCFIFLLLSGGGYYNYTYHTPVIIISVDINPSIELGINRFDKVITVESYNEDGDAILSSLDVYDLNYTTALNYILTDKNMEPYLTPEQLTTITVFGKNQKKQNKMLTDVTLCTASYQNISCSLGRSEEVAAAHAAGLSYGKYKAFLELQALDPEMTAEDVTGLTMRQIRDKINALSDHSDNSTTTEDTTVENKGQNTEYGTGQGKGKGQGNGNGNGNRNGRGWKQGRENSYQN